MFLTHVDIRNSKYRLKHRKTIKQTVSASFQAIIHRRKWCHAPVPRPLARATLEMHDINILNVIYALTVH